jgi:hypothetical protein
VDVAGLLRIIDKAKFKIKRGKDQKERKKTGMRKIKR